MIPDYYLNVDKCNKVYQNIIPFLEKTPIAIFRGSQTGGIYNMNEVLLRKIPRLNGVHLSLMYPYLLDIKIINTYTCQCNGDAKYIDYMNRTFGKPANSIPIEQFNKYRYLICFDGNSGPPYERPEAIMMSGSVPLIQTKYHKYWGFLLEDNIHYIKIKDDLTNLVDTVVYLNSNSGIAENIAKNAKELAEAVILPEAQEQYFIEVMNRISEYTQHVCLD